MGRYPLQYLGENIPDIDDLPIGATWAITGNNTLNKPLGWTEQRIIIISFRISEYFLKIAANAERGKLAVRVRPGSWREI